MINFLTHARLFWLGVLDFDQRFKAAARILLGSRAFDFPVTDPPLLLNSLCVIRRLALAVQAGQVSVALLVVRIVTVGHFLIRGQITLGGVVLFQNLNNVANFPNILCAVSERLESAADALHVGDSIARSDHFEFCCIAHALTMLKRRGIVNNYFQKSFPSQFHLLHLLTFPARQYQRLIARLLIIMQHRHDGVGFAFEAGHDEVFKQAFVRGFGWFCGFAEVIIVVAHEESLA